MVRGDVDAITEAFLSRNKRREQYERYAEENRRGARVTLVAVVGERVVGYGNVLWESGYEPFRRAGIPEINDLNVVAEHQNRGVGRALIRRAEGVVAEAGRAVVGIGVGQTPDYAAAQHLYPRLGYVPDGTGPHATRYGDVVYLTKRLRAVVFREATVADVPAMSEVRLSVRENVLSDPRKVTREMYVAYLGEAGKGWLCEEGGEVVGFSVASLADASIWALFVRPEHEGRGVGARLLRLATDWLFRMGASSITLGTEAGTRADTFYERQGWQRGEIKQGGEVTYLLRRAGRT